MRLLLVAAGVAAAVRQAAAVTGKCLAPTAEDGYPLAAQNPHKVATTDLTPGNSFKIEYTHGAYCTPGFEGIITATACTIADDANDPYELSGCVSRALIGGVTEKVRSFGKLAKKCKPIANAGPSDFSPATANNPKTSALECFKSCQTLYSTGSAALASPPHSGMLTVAWKKDAVCDCHVANTYGATCSECDGDYADGVEIYAPDQGSHNYVILPDSCTPASTDDEEKEEESAASLPLAGATVVAAGVASLCV